MPDPVPASSEPRPENPYPQFIQRLAWDPFECREHRAWDEGFAAGRAAFDAVVAERDGWQENAEDAARQIVGARAERDAAITAGQKLADEVDRALKATENSGTAQRHLIRSIEALGILEPALATFRSVSGSSEPRKETT